MEEALDRPLRDSLALIQDRILTRSTYFGVPTLKHPLDAWVYQEIVIERRPDIIIEIGNKAGGSALMLAHLCDLIGHGRIIGVDLSHDDVPATVKQHPRITFLDGDASARFDEVRAHVSAGDRVMVIEDSSHTYENTLAVLRTYSGLVKPGDYFIVEDGICHHGLNVGPSPGPYEAVEAFVRENSTFVIDRDRESFGITWNPKGYLRRVHPIP